MAISKINIRDFLVFQGEFTADLCRGVNVFIGSNGTGKTTLLRAIAVQPIVDSEYYHYHDGTFAKIPTLREVGPLLGTGYIQVEPFENDDYDIRKYIFIPADEMLSHHELLPLDLKFALPSYGASEIDLLVSAAVPITKEITPNAALVLDKIKSIIGGEVIFDGKEFFTVKANGTMVPFVLEASGYRKFGLLWKLLRNGLLESGSVLFWDEPENSLNPELISDLVDILLTLSRNGVQVFIATHSELLASYFDVNRQTDDEVMFHSLYKNEQGHIGINSNDRFGWLTPNTLTEEPVKLYKKQIQKGLGNG